jgi:hypothetical protein
MENRNPFPRGLSPLPTFKLSFCPPLSAFFILLSAFYFPHSALYFQRSAFCFLLCLSGLLLFPAPLTLS